MMREAQRMMQDPQFQLQMEQMMKQQNMQNAIRVTKQSISDPHKLKQLELKTKLALADGEKKLAEIEKQQQQQRKVQQESPDGENDDDDKKVLPKDDDNDDDTNKNDATVKVADESDTTAIVNDENNDEEDIPEMPALSLN